MKILDAISIKLETKHLYIFNNIFLDPLIHLNKKKTMYLILSLESINKV